MKKQQFSFFGLTTNNHLKTYSILEVFYIHKNSRISSRHEYVATKKYEREFFQSGRNPYRGKAVLMPMQLDTIDVKSNVKLLLGSDIYTGARLGGRSCSWLTLPGQLSPLLRIKPHYRPRVYRLWGIECTGYVSPREVVTHLIPDVTFEVEVRLQFNQVAAS